MKALLATLLLSALPSVAAPAKPDASQLPPRVKAEVKKEVAAYAKLGDFKVSSRELIRENGVAHTVINTAFIARDGRAGLKTETVGSPGKPGRVLKTVLFDGKELIQSSNGGPESHTFLNELKSDSDVVSNLFLGTIGLRFILKRFDPAWKTSSTYLIHNMGHGKLHIERNIQLPRKGSTMDLLVTARPDKTIEKAEMHIKENGKEVLYRELVVGKPARLAAGYSFQWSSFAPPLSPNFSISPGTRAVFRKAASLYGNVKSFSADLEGNTVRSGEAAGAEAEKGRFLWDRSDRVRYERSQGGAESQIVADGTNAWLLKSGKYESIPIRRSFRTPNLFDVLLMGSTHGLGFAEGMPYLSQLLKGHPPTDWSRYSRLKAVVQGANTLDGMPSDEVLINGTATYGTGTEVVTNELKFWFAKADGRLLQIETKNTFKNNQSTVDTVQIKNQKFNVEFPQSTWKFIPPKGAEETRAKHQGEKNFGGGELAMRVEFQRSPTMR